MRARFAVLVVVALGLPAAFWTSRFLAGAMWTGAGATVGSLR